MGTRGLYGFVINGETKATYNHWDSYPSGLGNEIKDFLSNNPYEVIREVARKIRVVASDAEPTADDICKYGKYYDENVNGGSVKDYYALLRDLQGKLQSYIEDPELDIMIDNKDFIQDSLFCEWAYLINFDTGNLEIYQGFRKSPPFHNRYSNGKSDGQGYYPCEMIKVIPIESVRDFDMNSFEEGLNNDED
jgi:hypothetical protein